MSKLKDILSRKNKNQTEQPVIQEEKPKFRKYNTFWLQRVAEARGFDINHQGGKVDGILDALNRKDGHCPCGGNGDAFLCPCVVMREKRICKCGLFVTHKPLEPKGTSVGKIKEK